MIEVLPSAINVIASQRYSLAMGMRVNLKPGGCHIWCPEDVSCVPPPGKEAGAEEAWCVVCSVINKGVSAEWGQEVWRPLLT